MPNPQIKQGIFTLEAVNVTFALAYAGFFAMRENPLLSWLYLHLFFAMGNTGRRAPSAHAIPTRTIRVLNTDEEKEPNAQAGSHPSWHSEELPRSAS